MSATRFSTLRTRSAALAAALAITASACGGSDSTATTTASTDTMTESSTATSDAMTDDTMTEDTMTEDTMSEDSMTDSTEAAGSDTTAAHSGDSMVEGSTLWTSADGKVSMEIDPTWTDEAAGVAGGAVLGAWTIGTDGTNISVVDAPTGEAGLQEFVDATAAQLGEIDTFTLVDSGVRKGPHGDDIGYLEYTGTNSGFDGHIIQILSVANGHAAIATFTTGAETYESMSESVLPLIETIQAL